VSIAAKEYFIMQLPSPKELKAKLPLSQETSYFISQSRNTIRNILSGKDSRLAIIAGPCSIHDKTSALEYADLFKKLAEKVKNSCYLVMRAYVEKPRTTTGWKGYLYDPYLDGSHDFNEGLFLARELLLELAELKIPAATEFVDTLATPFIEDLISWGFVGARTSASQPHRHIASYLSLPMGFKNGTDGNIDNAINGVITAKEPHAFLHISEEGSLAAVQTRGNPDAHIVLRGSSENSNYDPLSLQRVKEKLMKARLEQKMLIDCAHGNCQKQYELQKKAFYSIMQQVVKEESGIFGLMLESHLESGNQALSHPGSLRYGVSITDPCLDWSTTEELVLFADSLLTSSLSSSTT
jgi:3-deoxy-7-phosphoheptulonate synthase